MFHKTLSQAFVIPQALCRRGRRWWGRWWWRLAVAMIIFNIKSTHIVFIHLFVLEWYTLMMPSTPSRALAPMLFIHTHIITHITHLHHPYHSLPIHSSSRSCCLPLLRLPTPSVSPPPPAHYSVFVFVSHRGHAHQNPYCPKRRSRRTLRGCAMSP